MTGKSSELNKELLAELIVDTVAGVTVEADDGSFVVDLEFVNIETQTGQAAAQSELLNGAVIDKDPVHDDMPVDVEDATVLLLNEPIEVESADVDTQVNIESPDQLQMFLDQEEKQLREKVDQITDAGANVVFCQKGIDDLAQHFLAKEGILAVRRAKKSDMKFLKNVLEASIVSDLDSARPRTSATAVSPGMTTTSCSTWRAPAMRHTA
jgi:thermosome subunit